jgi:hypothetical protein
MSEALIFHLNGYGVILSEIDMTPTLSSEAASELALLHFVDQYPHLATPPEQLSSTRYVFDPGFLFDRRESGAYLVWEIRLAHDASMIDDRYYLDAHREIEAIRDIETLEELSERLVMVRR